LKKETSSKFALPAIRTRFSSAGSARCIVILRQKRRFDATNLHLYHYAGNNPVRYIDPDGAFDWDEGKTSGSVQRNDTLSEVTKEFNDKNGTNVDYNDVAAANGIKDPDKIKPGQKLDFSSFLPNNNSDQNKGQVPQINTSLITASQKK